MSNTPKQNTKPLYDSPAIVEALRLIIPAGQVTELRALDATTDKDRWSHTAAGYFDDAEKLAAAVATIQSAKGVYFVPNPVDAALLSRAANRIRKAPKGESTQDNHVVKRLWLLIDCDAQRPSGISSSDAEHEAAIARARDVFQYLRSSCGWPDPIAADSGNGAHLLYRIDLPADDGGLVQRCLTALADRFDDEQVKIDRTVYNPARIWKLYGTLACKGDDTPDRPHRIARILSQPDKLAAVASLLLADLAAQAAVEQPQKPRNVHNGQPFDIESFIGRHNLDVTGPEDWNGRQGRGRRWTFNASPMCGHSDGAAFVIEHASGAITAGCHHNSCSWGWAELRARLEPTRKSGGSFGPADSARGVSDDDWPSPDALPEELLSVQPFDPLLLPNQLRPWIEDIANRIQCPIDFPAVTAMVALGAIVGRKMGIRPKSKDDWLVIPNLWGACIGRPGVMKTPAIQEPLKPLKRLEIEAKQRYQKEVVRFESKKIIAAQKRKVIEGQLRAAIKNDEDTSALAESLAADESNVPVRKRYLVNDSTVEKLGELLNQNSNGLLIYRDELIGLLKSLDKDGQEGARSFYLEAWNGAGRFTYDRIGRGTIDIDAAIVSIIGGIQPGRLQHYLRSAVKNDSNDDGLIQRFQLSVWPDVSKHWKNIDQWPDTKAKQAAYDVFTRIDAFRPEVPDSEDIAFLRFTADAQFEFDDWRASLERRIRSGDEQLAIESHLAKYRSLIPSLALLKHLADDHAGPVCVGCLSTAIEWGVYLESHAQRMYAYGVSPTSTAVRQLARKILSGDVRDGFAARDVYRNCWSGLTNTDEVQEAAGILADLNWLREQEQPSRGRTRHCYRINPRIQELGKRRTDRTDKSPLVSVLSVTDSPAVGNSAGDSDDQRGWL